MFMSQSIAIVVPAAIVGLAPCSARDPSRRVFLRTRTYRDAGTLAPAARRRVRSCMLRGMPAHVASLDGQVALAAGGTRGAGRGIARALAEAGATVYCTGRSIRGQPSPYQRSETIDETAEMIAAAGGTAIPIRVDHTVESEVEVLIDRIERERGRLDVLADSVAGEGPRMPPWGSLLATH